ncbi:conserved exported hypothetical protein [Desulfosarcina cetonica]|uniref:ComEA family DNA-binding protein n=1 Tax=Desulfosarcina cetonica TaxID=90730 RepID=UPI0006D0764E|nr:ComEA family DNA-binding protein [Desulfosarcina cetonica]VTR65033.1 conserved exported hypothetical protein [Desulfosarcina cetonica]
MKSTIQKNFYQTICIALLVIFVGAYCAAAAETININTATVEDLVKLDRVGQKYAERIVAYRNEFGPFEKPEDIMNVKGIGEKTWEVNKNRITI